MVPLQSLSKPKVVIVALLATFFIAGSAYFYLSSKSHMSLKSPTLSPVNKLAQAAANSAVSNQSSQVKSLTIQTSTPTSLSSTAYTGWQEKKKQSYSIQYPKGWYSSSDLGVNDVQGDSEVISNEKVSLSSLISNNGVYVTINATDTPNDRDSIVLASPDGIIFQGQYDTKYDILTRIGTVKIQGVNAVAFTEDFTADPGVKDGYTYAYIFEKNNKYYDISFISNTKTTTDNNAQIRNLIVNSISFLSN